MRRIWSVEELQSVLLAANEVNGMTIAAVGDGQNRAAVCAYRQGFQAALVAVALAVGLQAIADTLELRRAE